MIIPKNCFVCEYRIVDEQNGDRCKKTDMSIMDNRFTYKAELHKVKLCRDICCPLTSKGV